MHSFDEHFKKFHRLSLSILKTFGFGQGIMESRIRLEVDDLLGRFGQRKGLAFNPDVDITSAVSNVICSIMFGRRWNLDDTACKERVDLIRTLVRQLEKPTTINFFPVVRFLPKYRQAIASQRSTHDKIRDCIHKIMDDVDKDDTSDCFYSVFKKEMQTQVEMGEIKELDNDQMYFTIRDLFVAGTDTTATTLQWFIIEMANHQDVQSMIRHEMDSVVGRQRHPSLDDKANLPLFDATLLEVMRYRTLVPLALPHLTNKDTIIGGMHIPRGTLVTISFQLYVHFRIHEDLTIFSIKAKKVDSVFLKRQHFHRFFQTSSAATWIPKSGTNQMSSKLKDFLTRAERRSSTRSKSFRFL